MPTIISVQGLKQIEIIVRDNFLDNVFLFNTKGSTAPILRLPNSGFSLQWSREHMLASQLGAKVMASKTPKARVPE